VARAALGDLATDSQNILLAARWVTDRYREFANTRRLKQRRRVGAFDIPAVLTTGTVHVTRDDPVVPGGAVAGPTWTADLVGRYFQAATVWYRIIGFDPTFNLLELDVPYAEDTNTASTYRIVQRYAKLDPRASFLGTFAHPRRRRPLRTDINMADLNVLQPNRQFSSGGPYWVVEYNEENGVRQVEVYPYSNTIEAVTYIYWEAVPECFDLLDELPHAVDVQALKEGVLIDVMRYKAAQAAEMKQLDMAAFWRNEYRVQEGRWEKAQARMVKMDRGIEDLHLMLGDHSTNQFFDIRNAHDEIYARGNRP
jgi:hypothetical protein